MSELTDLLERFRRGPELIAVATTGASNTELDYVPGEGKWSLRQTLCHVVDSELVAAVRMRRTIAEHNPLLPGFDGEAWAERLDYRQRRISDAMQTFRIVRSDTYELLKPLPEEAFARPCTHGELGPLTLRNLLVNCVEHAESHVPQMQRIRQAYKAARAAAK